MKLHTRVFWVVHELRNKLRQKAPGIHKAIASTWGLAVATARFCWAMLGTVVSMLAGPARFVLRTLLANKLASGVVVLGVAVIALLLWSRTPDDQPLPEPVFDKRPHFTIGVIVSLTGGLARHGNEMLRGYETAIRAYNMAGGVRIAGVPHNLTLVVYDDESSQIRAGEVARLMFTHDEPPVLIGPYSSALAQLVVGVANENQVPVLLPVASAAGFGPATRGVLLLQTPPERHLVDAARLFAQQVREKRAALADDDTRFAGGPVPRVVLAAGPDQHSQSVMAGVKLELDKIGELEYVDFDLGLPEEEYNEAKAALADTDAMFVSAFAPGASRLIETVATDGINLPFLALTHCEIARIARLQPVAAEGALCAIHWQAEARFASSAPLTGDGDIRLAYFDEYGSRPSHHAAAAAAAIQVIAAALRQADAGGTSLGEALFATSIDTAYGPVRFDARGRNIAKPMVIAQITQSRYVPVAPAQIAQGAPNPTRPQLAESQ